MECVGNRPTKRTINMSDIEWIKVDDKVIAIIIPQSFRPDKTTFVTPEKFNQQVGFIVYPSKRQISSHKHIPLERNIIGTSETLILLSGKVEAKLYDDQNTLITTKILNTGDVIVLVSGGHGFNMLEDSVFLEVKQGPYTSVDEKEIFGE